MSNQKVSALMKKLKDAGRVNKVDDKKKAYFSIAE
jgi:DNA-binding transcriptional regulator GbsR (MarR family)